MDVVNNQDVVQGGPLTRSPLSPSQDIDILAITAQMASLTIRELDDIRPPFIYMSDPQPFRFLDLPAEIRNHVYRAAITPGLIRYHVVVRVAPRLLRTSKQVANEFSSIYYGNEFFNVILIDPINGRLVAINSEIWLRSFLEGYNGCCVFGRLPSRLRHLIDQRAPWVQESEATNRLRVHSGTYRGALVWEGNNGTFKYYMCRYYIDPTRVDASLPVTTWDLFFRIV